MKGFCILIYWVNCDRKRILHLFIPIQRAKVNNMSAVSYNLLFFIRLILTYHP